MYQADVSADVYLLSSSTATPLPPSCNIPAVTRAVCWYDLGRGGGEGGAHLHTHISPCPLPPLPPSNRAAPVPPESCGSCKSPWGGRPAAPQPQRLSPQPGPGPHGPCPLQQTVRAAGSNSTVSAPYHTAAQPTTAQQAAVSLTRALSVTPVCCALQASHPSVPAGASSLQPVLLPHPPGLSGPQLKRSLR